MKKYINVFLFTAVFSMEKEENFNGIDENSEKNSIEYREIKSLKDKYKEEQIEVIQKFTADISMIINGISYCSEDVFYLNESIFNLVFINKMNKKELDLLPNILSKYHKDFLFYIKDIPMTKEPSVVFKKLFKNFLEDLSILESMQKIENKMDEKREELIISIHKNALEIKNILNSIYNQEKEAIDFLEKNIFNFNFIIKITDMKELLELNKILLLHFPIIFYCKKDASMLSKEFASFMDALLHLDIIKKFKY